MKNRQQRRVRIRKTAKDKEFLSERESNACSQIMIQVKHTFGPLPAASGHREVKQATSISKEMQDRLLNGRFLPFQPLQSDDGLV